MSQDILRDMPQSFHVCAGRYSAFRVVSDIIEKFLIFRRRSARVPVFFDASFPHIVPVQIHEFLQHGYSFLVGVVVGTPPMRAKIYPIGSKQGALTILTLDGGNFRYLKRESAIVYARLSDYFSVLLPRFYSSAAFSIGGNVKLNNCILPGIAASKTKSTHASVKIRIFCHDAPHFPCALF